MDVARAAGVSQPTVSRVFSPGTKVSKELASRVRDAAASLGYRPNTLARSLITGQSKTIGLIVAYLDNPFYTEVLERLSRRLRQEGYSISIFMASNSPSEVDDITHDLLDQQVDGIILASVSMSSELTLRLSQQGVPLILFNRGQDGIEASQVTSANYAGGRRVAEFLLAGGHTRMAHISGWQGASTGRDRRAGFEAGLAAEGQSPIVVIDGMYDRKTAADAARIVLQQNPDAIFVGNDHMAFAVLEVIRATGLRPGIDISVVGYDDVAMAAWPSFALTTIRQPAMRMVEAAVKELLAQLGPTPPPPASIEIEGPLILRETARIPPEWSTT